MKRALKSFSWNPRKKPPYIEPRQAYVIIKYVERRYSIFWIIIFTILLVVNVIAILGGRMQPADQVGGPADEVAFLDGADQVALEWWPEAVTGDVLNVREADTPETGRSVKHPPGVPGNGAPEGRDYKELMPKYIESLERYLTAYFRIARMANGAREE